MGDDKSVPFWVLTKYRNAVIGCESLSDFFSVRLAIPRGEVATLVGFSECAFRTHGLYQRIPGRKKDPDYLQRIVCISRGQGEGSKHVKLGV